MFTFTRKAKDRSPISGDIEMKEIPLEKRLGKKVVTRTRNRRLAPNRSIYRQRVKLSHCRKVKRTQCLKKRSCKYTNGSSRKYCRKRRNQVVF